MWQRSAWSSRRRRRAAPLGLIALVVATASFALACSDDDGRVCCAGPTPTFASGPRTSPSATASATTSADPRASLVPAFRGLPALDRPTVMVEAPGGVMLVALQEGRIVAFPKANPAAASDALDWRSKTSRQGNEEGLLGLALDPAFATNGFVYVYYSATPGDRRTVLSRLHAVASASGVTVDPASELVILTVPQPFPNHKGGQLSFGPDGMLYLGLGDGGSQGDPNGNGQDLKQNLLASIIRLDVSGASAARPYRIPADNPFAGATDGTKHETWAYGFRNPWRFSWDRATGVMWAGDVGQNDREEVDIVEKGANYGWNTMEATACYRPASGCDTKGLTLPVAEYRHTGGNCSITGGYVYRGKAVPALTGWYLYADYCSGALWAIRADTARAGQASSAEQLLDTGLQVSSFAEDADGELYILAFDGRIYRFAP